VTSFQPLDRLSKSYHSYHTYYIHISIMSDTVELKKTVPVVAAEEKVPEKGLTEDSFVLAEFGLQMEMWLMR
jgi:hypothetical protein